ncbi:hypothetical protein [Mucilaginibacter sp.]|uniref:hypothetical protein n=1 Tax=Mucilaginibacter sp. TaxID=1882438 RepID=UPI002848C063|nr:hypothetical protein [Mucilaginibacter sp.]MDR3694590.1 hypothetical protein [Mucilaginibacter sp.]
MNMLFVLGGFTSLVYGVYDGIKEIKKISKGEADKLGADIKIIGADFGFIIIGIYLIIKYI